MSAYVNTLLYFCIIVMMACSNPSASTQEHSKSEGAEIAPPVTQPLGPGVMPVINYVTPSVDRTEAGKPAGSPFQPELLQEIFPLDAAGLNRFSGSNGVPKLLENQTGTQSRIVYKNQNSEQEVALTIVDSGILGLTMDQIVSWIKSPRSVETNNTIDRTGELKGFPYYEHYLKDAQVGELHLLVNRRFEVVVNGKQVPYADLKQVLMDWDLSSLY